jgi:hypothetical protein
MLVVMTIERSEDDLLVAELDATQSATWREMRELVASGAVRNRAVPWTTAGGSYPIYDGPVGQARNVLVMVGAVTPLYDWMNNGMPALAADGSLTAPDAVRAATAAIRGERFTDGVIARAAEDGTLHAVLAALLGWYDGRRGRA